ncbi:hypothetical protein GCM10011495_18860 [Hymenobacter frigidus]|uniref:T9SS type A sorting domain-containing protein n=1 Tax=Hymenobacter frigidus TaxID=1524095 RepID=A0ABQ2A5W0_9BACT|nr:T9SS type A sorting domain-containing protein [Hymenobacter frigidus]GGH85193.1 hypothetical protein GCM10011495_18860 [Hymenobacter frigidus]
MGTGTANGVNDAVSALALASNGDVYVGGGFRTAGGITANYVAKWDGAVWSSLGTGTANGVYYRIGSRPAGSVIDFAFASNGDLYVGGSFRFAGGRVAENVAKWNGTAWSSLGTGVANGVSGTVHALAVAGNGDLYMTGEFIGAGAITVNHIAKWDGSVWSALGAGTGGGFGNSGLALALARNGVVYMAGVFEQAGGVVVNHIAKWDGTAWSTLGTGLTNGVNGGRAAVRSLALANNGDLYVGGRFLQSSGVVTNNVTRWNGTTWNTLGTGLNSYVDALALGTNGQLYVGGEFTTTGDGGKAMAHFGIYDPNAPLAAKASARTAPVALFPNPAHGTATLRLPAGTPRLPLLLTDALGRIVRRYPAPAGPDATLDLRGLPAGVYMVSCGQVTQRLVVE